MGKPSSTRLPKKQTSEESFSTASEMSGIRKIPINGPKMDVQKKRKRRRTKKKIKKLFENLRNESNISINSTINSTVVLLDDTVPESTNATSPNRKRKLSETSVYEQNKCIKTADSTSVRDAKPCRSINVTIFNIDNDSRVEPVADDKNDVVVTADTTLKDNDVIITSDQLNKTKCDDVVITNVIPSGSKTPRKFGSNMLKPMQCSTPISKTNNSINNNAETAQNFNTDANVTREINRDSYLTIDLTSESDPNRSSVSKTQFNTVIDLDNTHDTQDCTFVSISNASLSMSGDSDVTVLRNKSQKVVDRFVNGISKMKAAEKGRLLEMITQKIFSGCKTPEKKSSASKIRELVNKQTETPETSYIREVILGRKPSRNSIGSNIYNPSKDRSKTGLRMIVIDGSNVAMEHGKGKVFSVRGLQICIDYFVKRGHVVKAFVPRFRCKAGKSTHPRLLDELERRGLVVYTPSRELPGRTITPYDDRYIVQCAAEFDAIIVSGDNYRDLHAENPRWRFVIENRLLPFTWVNDMIMFPRDPLGRNGPSLEAFLRHPATQTIPSIVL